MSADDRRTKRELPVPGAALRDADARELVRVWAAGGAQHISIATGLWKDPAAWGIALVDLARHVARAYEQAEGVPRAQAIERIKAGFDAEWENSTDDPTGELQS